VHREEEEERDLSTSVSAKGWFISRWLVHYQFDVTYRDNSEGMVE